MRRMSAMACACAASPAAEISRRVTQALQTVSLTGFEERYPAQLFWRPEQRRRNRRVWSWNHGCCCSTNPFNALDAKLRGTMQMEMRQLIKRIGITAIFVTHDQEEALKMSDRIARGCVPAGSSSSGRRSRFSTGQPAPMSRFRRRVHISGWRRAVKARSPCRTGRGVSTKLGARGARHAAPPQHPDRAGPSSLRRAGAAASVSAAILAR